MTYPRFKRGGWEGRKLVPGDRVYLVTRHGELYPGEECRVVDVDDSPRSRQRPLVAATSDGQREHVPGYAVGLTDEVDWR